MSFHMTFPNHNSRSRHCDTIHLTITYRRSAQSLLMWISFEDFVYRHVCRIWFAEIVLWHGKVYQSSDLRYPNCNLIVISSNSGCVIIWHFINQWIWYQEYCDANAVNVVLSTGEHVPLYNFLTVARCHLVDAVLLSWNGSSYNCRKRWEGFKAMSAFNHGACRRTCSMLTPLSCQNSINIEIHSSLALWYPSKPCPPRKGFVGHISLCWETLSQNTNKFLPGRHFRLP